MLQVTIRNGSQLLALGTVIGTAGVVGATPNAQANPLAPYPLAPACTDYVFPGEFRVQGTPDNFINGDSRWQVSFTSTGKNAGTGPAVVTFDDGGHVNGHLVDGGINGMDINFHILWDNNTAWYFTGGIWDDGVARGRERISAFGDLKADWYSITPLACARSAAPPAAAAAPAAPQKKMATVTSDVDVFNIAADDVPDDSGVVGEKIGTLRGGQRVEIGDPCNPNDWCKVLAPELPNGNGFVLGHIQL
jgi:hypothetical protein